MPFFRARYHLKTLNLHLLDRYYGTIWIDMSSWCQISLSTQGSRLSVLGYNFETFEFENKKITLF